MPVDYEIYENGYYVYAKATGVLTPEEIMDYEREVKLNPTIKSGYKELFDVKWRFKLLPSLQYSSIPVLLRNRPFLVGEPLTYELHQKDEISKTK